MPVPALVRVPGRPVGPDPTQSPGRPTAARRHRARGALVTERFPADVLELFAREEEVRIETTRRDGTTKRRIIWIVVDEGDVFVRSVRGERGRWYRHLLERPAGAIHAG